MGNGIWVVDGKADVRDLRLGKDRVQRPEDRGYFYLYVKIVDSLKYK